VSAPKRPWMRAVERVRALLASPRAAAPVEAPAALPPEMAAQAARIAAMLPAARESGE
jgi:hypothetical protein